MPSPATASGGTASVIGSDLTIVGSGLKIIAQQSLQVDGEVQGDVIGTQVTIGPTGKVTGLVNADRVQVNGTVNGTIRGQDVILSSTAAVEGDIFHGSIMLEQGASFEGRSRRPKDPADLKPNLSAQPARPVAAAQPASGTASGDKPQPMAMANGATGAADNT